MMERIDDFEEGRALLHTYHLTRQFSQLKKQLESLERQREEQHGLDASAKAALAVEIKNLREALNGSGNFPQQMESLAKTLQSLSQRNHELEQEVRELRRTSLQTKAGSEEDRASTRKELHDLRADLDSAKTARETDATALKERLDHVESENAVLRAKLELLASERHTEDATVTPRSKSYARRQPHNPATYRQPDIASTLDVEDVPPVSVHHGVLPTKTSSKRKAHTSVDGLGQLQSTGRRRSFLHQESLEPTQIIAELAYGAREPAPRHTSRPRHESPFTDLLSHQLETQADTERDGHPNLHGHAKNAIETETPTQVVPELQDRRGRTPGVREPVRLGGLYSNDEDGALDDTQNESGAQSRNAAQEVSVVTVTKSSAEQQLAEAGNTDRPKAKGSIAATPARNNLSPITALQAHQSPQGRSLRSGKKLTPLPNMGTVRLRGTNASDRPQKRRRSGKGPARTSRGKFRLSKSKKDDTTESEDSSATESEEDIEEAPMIKRRKIAQDAKRETQKTDIGKTTVAKSNTLMEGAAAGENATGHGQGKAGYGRREPGKGDTGSRTGAGSKAKLSRRSKQKEKLDLTESASEKPSQ